MNPAEDKIRANAATPAIGINPDTDVKPIAIIGLGNEIAGDDGIGIVIVKRLQNIMRHRKDIENIPMPWAGFSLLDVLVDREQAVLVDCLCSNLYPPGTIVHLDKNDFRGSVRLNSFHDINYPTVLALGRKMGWRMPEKLAIWGIEGKEMGTFTESLTPEVEKAINPVIHEILDYLDEKGCVA